MSQSLSKLYVHITFHVKRESARMRKEERASLFAYMGSVLNSIECTPIKINGVDDHVHILCVLSKNIALSKLVEDVKRHSSRWIKTLAPYYKTFAWQGGYGGFSVSPSMISKTSQYIENQEEHHKKVTYREECISFFKAYGIEFDLKFLDFDD
jgi:putative transposase